jgi:hypothetical protein
MQNRSPNAILSPIELAELRRIAGGLTSNHGAVLIGMQLVKLDEAGALVLTDLGRQRLKREDPKAWRGPPGTNPFGLNKH